MPQTDSVLLHNDSILNSDSLHRADSIFSADSILLNDTVVTKIVRGFQGIAHPSLPTSESWVFGTVLFLFILMVVSYIRSSNWLYESVRTFLQVKERSSIFSKTTINDFQSRFFLIVFSIAVFSLYLYYLMHNPQHGFEFLKFLSFFGITALFFGLKYLLIDLVGYVFVDKSTLKVARESYFNILTYLGVTIYPILIFQLYFPQSLNSVSSHIALILCILASILLIIKLFQIFFHKILASFYIMLYLCTLEILPIFFLLGGLRMIV